jgi:hypothetical protein
MILMRIFFMVAVSLALTRSGLGQGFINLNFEQSTIVTSYPSGGGWDTGTANVPGWAWTPGGIFGNGDSNIMGYNDFALSAAAVDLEGADFGYPYSAIEGNYSIFMQGGSYNGAGGSTISQTGQIPLDAKSIIYWGGNFQVSFDGQLLSFNRINNFQNYAVWDADISAYAGQTGELLFTCADYNAGMLDNIQFSSLPVPEPSTFSLFGICTLFLLWRMKRPNNSPEPPPTGAVSPHSRLTWWVARLSFCR